MSRYSLEEFVQKTSQKDQQQGLFELESSAMLEVNLRGQVWTKTGAMVAYQGGITFQREGMLEGGMGKAFKRALTGEGASLTKAQGVGRVYLADAHKKVSILRLESQSLFVNGNDLLAFEDGIQWDIKMMRRMSSMMAGGLFNVKLEGTGLVAITSHGDPLTLRVGHNRSVVTDPNATVAWSGNLEPEMKTDITVGTFFGRGSGEAFQLKFEGQEGFVVVQPYEEIAWQQGAAR
jgi:uncharacterized protein (AIM24 family)